MLEGKRLQKQQLLSAPFWFVEKVCVTLCVLKVVSPQGSDFVLTAHIPHCETDVLVLHRLDVKS